MLLYLDLIITVFIILTGVNPALTCATAEHEAATVCAMVRLQTHWTETTSTEIPEQHIIIIVDITHRHNYNIYVKIQK